MYVGCELVRTQRHAVSMAALDFFKSCNRRRKREARGQRTFGQKMAAILCNHQEDTAPLRAGVRPGLSLLAGTPFGTFQHGGGRETANESLRLIYKKDTRTYAHICIQHTHTQTHTHAFSPTNMHMHVHTHTHAQTNTPPTRIHIHTHSYLFTYSFTTHAHAHRLRILHTHKHTLTRFMFGTDLLTKSHLSRVT